MFTEAASQVVDFGYRQVGYPALNSFTGGDPEKAHQRALWILEKVDQSEKFLALAKSIGDYTHPLIEVQFGPYKLRHPVGLAAGMDKDARTPRAFGSIFSEITLGSGTYREWSGNDRPRIWRYPKANSQNNAMGFPGIGTAAVFRNLYYKVPDYKARDFMVTVSAAASFPSFENGTVVEDYVNATKDLTQVPNLVDAVEENVSSPNTKKLGVFFSNTENVRDTLRACKEVVVKENKHRSKNFPPILFGAKISPDLIDEDEQGVKKYARLDSMIQVLTDVGVDFVTATNTTTDRRVQEGLVLDPLARKQITENTMRGGTSGQALKRKSFDTNEHIFKVTNGDLLQKACGGIVDEIDVWTFVSYAGANFVESLTGLVLPDSTSLRYTRNPNQRLARMLDVAGLNINELRGSRTPMPQIYYGSFGRRTYHYPQGARVKNG